MNWLILAQMPAAAEPEGPPSLISQILSAALPWIALLFPGFELRSDIPAWVPLVLGAGVIGLLAWLTRVPLSYNFNNLLVRWPTSTLTALAFILVIALQVVMSAFVNGMYELTESSGRRDNVLILSEGSTDETFSNLGYSDTSDAETVAGIARDGTGPEARPLVSKEGYIPVNQLIDNPQPGRPRRRFLQVRGVDNPQISAKVHDREMLPGGEWFSEAGVREIADPKTGATISAMEVVLGEGIAQEIGADRSPAQRAAAKNPRRLEPGDTFPVGDRVWYVTGVTKFNGATFDSECWLKQSLVGNLFGKNTYSSIVARAESAEVAVQLKDFLNNEFTKARVSAQVERDYYKNLQATNLQFLITIRFIAIVLAIGGGIGIMNTMFASVSQRSRDIGVLRLMGYPKLDVQTSFLFEALLLAFVGGLLGCLIGSLCHGATTQSTVSGGQGGGKLVVLKLIVDWPVLACGLLTALKMGLYGGLLPSISAMRMTALEALR